MKRKPLIYDGSVAAFFKATRGELDKRLESLFGNVSQGQRKAAALTAESMRDLSFQGWVSRVDGNDKDAALALHSALAQSLRDNNLSPAMRECLAAMHEAIANGVPADVATLTKATTGRPNHQTRDARLRSYVGFRKNWPTEDGEQPPMMEAIYKDAAKLFGVSVKTVKNICAGEPD